jgi:exopolysaccharide biosynthesis polyprenyl glycosylphosphotransferase
MVSGMTAWTWSARAGEERVRRARPRRRARTTPELGRGPRSGPNIRRRLVTIESIGLAVAWGLALSVGDLTGRRAASLQTIAAQTIVLTFAGIGLSFALGLYRSRVSAVRSATLERQAVVAGLLGGLAWALGKVTTAAPAASPVVLGMLATFAMLVTVRSCFDAWVTLLRRGGTLSRPVVLVGSSRGISDLAGLLTSHPEIGYYAVGHLDDAPCDDPEVGPWLGPLRSTATAARRAGATGAVIAANGIPSDELNDIVRDLHAAGLHVHLSSGLTRIGHRRVRQLPMAHEPFFYLEPVSNRRGALAVKRVIDLVGASVLLIVTMPISVVAAIAVKLTDGGPVLFHQVRVGKDGVSFHIHKFRTMTTDAESRLIELESANTRGGPFFKMSDDPRVTKVGRWLRASSIDELPQLVNVLRGELSLVGPRPALLEETARFDQGFLARLEMRPGITGLWQVEARHNPSYNANRHLDLFYIENWRIALDLAILVATVHTVTIDTVGSLRRARQRRRLEAADPPVAEPAELPLDQVGPSPAVPERETIEVGA